MVFSQCVAAVSGSKWFQTIFRLFWKKIGPCHSFGKGHSYIWFCCSVRFSVSVFLFLRPLFYLIDKPEFIAGNESPLIDESLHERPVYPAFNLKTKRKQSCPSPLLCVRYQTFMLTSCKRRYWANIFCLTYINVIFMNLYDTPYWHFYDFFLAYYTVTF